MNTAILGIIISVLLGAGALVVLSLLPGGPWFGSAQFVPFLLAAWAVGLWSMFVLYQLSDPRARRGGNFRLPGRTRSRGFLSRRADFLAGVGALAGLVIATSLVEAMKLGMPHQNAVGEADRHRLVLVDRGLLGVAIAIVSFFGPVVIN